MRTFGVMFYLLALAGCLLAPSAVHAAILAGPVVNPANGHTYYLLTQNDWIASEAEAVSLGGHLATVNDAAEGAWIYTTFSTFGGVNRNLWIGLFDPDPVNNSLDRSVRRTEFQWVSGEPVTYTNWSPLEPNNPLSQDPVPVPELYVHIWNPTDPFASAWNNYVNLPTLFGVQLHGVVEVAPVPEPSGLVLAGMGVGCWFHSRRRRRGGTGD